jgi:hypothetical protein
MKVCCQHSCDENFQLTSTRIPELTTKEKTWQCVERNVRVTLRFPSPFSFSIRLTWPPKCAVEAFSEGCGGIRIFFTIHQVLHASGIATSKVLNQDDHGREKMIRED